MRSSLSPIAVLGAGSWGTALAMVLARNHQMVKLWGHDAKHQQTMAASRCNEFYLPGIALPDNIQIYVDLAEALKDTNDVLLVIPSHAFHSIIENIAPYLTLHHRLVFATKGLDSISGKPLHEVIVEKLGFDTVFAVLSGPTFAKEVAEGLPTAITVATTNQSFAEDLIKRLHNPTFRVYTSQDVIGVQIGGAVKNVLAIAAGISDGLGYGANARCALITRGLTEMTRLGVAVGGQPETFTGLAGLGDLVLTSTDNQSRNRRFGLALGQGMNITNAEQNIHQVVEGIPTAKKVFQLAQQMKVSMPICEQVYRVLHEGITPQVAVQALLNREPRAENPSSP